MKRTIEIGNNSFPSTISVEKRDIKNAIQEQRAFEIFAEGVGPVYEYNADFTYQAGAVEKGSSIELELLNFGIE